MPICRPCGCLLQCIAAEHRINQGRTLVDTKVLAGWKLEEAGTSNGNSTAAALMTPAPEYLRIEEFPNEILKMVFDHLDAVAATSLGLVSKHFYELYHKAQPKLVKLNAKCTLTRSFCPLNLCCNMVCPFSGLVEQCSLKWHMAQWDLFKGFDCTMHPTSKFTPSLAVKWGTKDGSRLRSKALKK